MPPSFATALSRLLRMRGCVPRMLRSAFSAFTRVFDALRRCAADPGSIVAPGPGSAVHREERCTASGIRRHYFTLSQYEEEKKKNPADASAGFLRSRQ